MLSMLSGYGCNDHFLEYDTFLHSWQVVAEILKADDISGIIIDLGMYLGRHIPALTYGRLG